MSLAVLVAAVFVPGTAHARSGCTTHACLARTCKARSCHERVEWHRYRRSPMPWCTWGPESGGNYTAMNPTSTAGGKYQMLDQTFHAFGGPDFGGWQVTHDAARARPLLQERIARRVLAGQGLGAWVNC